VSDRRLIERGVMVVGEGDDAQRAALALEQAGYPVVRVLHAMRDGDGTGPGPCIESVQGHVGQFLVALDGSDERQVGVGAIVLALGNRRVATNVVTPKGCQVPVMTPLAWAARVRDDLLTEYRVAWARRRVIVLLDYPDDTPQETSAEALCAVSDVVAWAHPQVYVFYRNLQVDTHHLERLTRETREMGVVYCRYDQLELVFDDSALTVTFEEGQRIGDLLVVPKAIAPPASAADLAARLGIRLGEDGWLQDVNMRYVGAGQTVRRGIYVVGRCYLDADAETQAEDVRRLVGEVDALLAREVVPLPAEYAEVESVECIRCLTCIRTCPHQAVELRAWEDVTAAYVVPEACWGCGMCVANCPVRAITLMQAERLMEQEAV